MNDVKVIYWTMSGNTEAMAQAVAKGAGTQAVNVADARAEDLKDVKAFALGCPAMGDEVIEEGEMEPFVAEVEGLCAGKTVGLFGSYGWGDGQWMRDWVERMKNAGAVVVNDAGIIANGSADDDTLAALEEMGRQLASL